MESENQTMTEIQREIAAVMNPKLKEMDEKLERANEIQKELLSAQERGSKPDQPDVLEKEQELADLRASHKELEDKVRLLATRGINERSESKKQAFDDFWISDTSKVREAVERYGTLQQAIEQKAIDSSVLTNGGKLNAQQENQFMSYLADMNITLNRITNKVMTSDTANMDEIIAASRKIRARGTEASAVTVSDGISTSQRVLTAKGAVLAEDISLEFVEENIERGNINSTITSLLARQFANDANDLFYNGDEADTSGGATQAFLTQNDGVVAIAKADASVVDYDASSDTTVQAVLHGAMKAMGFQFKANALLTLEFFVPFTTAEIYANELTTRGTTFADAVLQNGLSRLPYFGMTVTGDPHLAGDEAFFTPSQNLVWGVRRGIRVETEWRPRKLAWEATLHAKMDNQYAKSEAIVLIDGIVAALRS